MAGEPVSIGNETQLRNWLNGKPKEFAQVIAMRAALRILPVAGRSVELPDDQLEQFQKLRLMLTTFRALFISWAARVYPITNFDADASAAALAFSTVVSASRRDNLPALHAIDLAVQSAADAVLAVVNFEAAAHGVTATAYAAENAAGPPAAHQIWIAVSFDAQWLTENIVNMKSEEFRRKLSNLALWPNGETADWARVTWETIQSNSDLHGSGFTIWLNWYTLRLAGQEGGMAPDVPATHGKALDIRIANQPDEWWQRDPAEVNADIAKWVEEARAEFKIRPDEWYVPNEDLGPELDADGDPHEPSDFDESELRPAEPPIGPGPQYEIRDGKLASRASAPLPDEQGSQAGLHQRLAREAKDLAARLEPLGNRYPHLLGAAREYAELTSGDVDKLDIAALWSVGGALSGFAQAFREQNVARTLEDPLEPQTAGLLNSVTRMHGAFILGFAEGRDLVERADAFALDSQRLAEIAEPGNVLINELSENRDLVDAETRRIHGPIRDFVIERGWGTARVGYAAYLAIRNSVRATIKVTIGSDPSVGSVLGLLGVVSLLGGDPNMEFVRAAIPFLQLNATQLLAFFSHSPEMRSYVEWALWTVRNDHSGPDR